MFTIFQPFSRMMRATWLRQLQAVGTGVGGVSIREVLADVAQRGGTQHSVHHSVGQHIGIRVAQQALFKRHLHAAQDQLAVLDQTVNIITMTNAHYHFLLSVRRGADPPAL